MNSCCWQPKRETGDRDRCGAVRDLYDVSRQGKDKKIVCGQHLAAAMTMWDWTEVRQSDNDK